jgi:RNA polymerase sigma factor (sigma-70 family)
MQLDQQDQQPGEMTDVLYERYAALIFTYLRQRTRTREDAEDLLEDIFIAAMEDEKFPYLLEQTQIAWLWRVAHNKLIDSFRRALARQHVSLDLMMETLFEDETCSPELAALRLDHVALVDQLLQQLSPQQQELMRLRFGQNLRNAEIAQLLGKQETAVRTMLSRTLNFLRTLIKNDSKESML